MRAKFATRATKATAAVQPVTPGDLDDWLKGAAAAERRWVRNARFSAAFAETVVIPTDDGPPKVLLGLGPTPSPWAYAAIGQLPAGRYRIEAALDADAATRAAVAYGLGGYAFDRYRKVAESDVELVWPEAADSAEVERLVDAISLSRDLINTPAQDMGPAELADAVRTVARRYKAKIRVIVGKELLKQNYPTIHAVGRASVSPPCLIDLRWGRPSDPKVTLVGKGVIFDSGGLDIKSANGMLLMKKDMGGAAIALGLARAIMDAELPVRLRLLIPAVENAVSGNALHPLDVITTRKGITVEVGNTDAEGRLILSDALAEASTESPELLVDFATLTGSARVALGTEVPALFSNDDAVAEGILASAEAVHDPVWRLPLVPAYRRHLESKVADTSNIASSPFGGAIIAGLFLEKFIDEGQPWVHFDAMAYNLDAQPGRPIGGEAMGLRAVYAYLVNRYGGFRS